MKILHICYSDCLGGAARAANRLHQAQRKLGINSFMLVVDKYTDDDYVLELNKLTKFRIKILNMISGYILRHLIQKNPVKHSLNIFSAGVVNAINKLNPDIVNIHWIGDNMLSIKEISKIKSPIIWTMHDMWAFSGCEHYDSFPGIRRYEDDYNKKDGIFDLNRIIYRYKKKKWSHINMQFVSPSRWLAECACRTSLIEGKRVHVIQNTIDHVVFDKVDKVCARKLLGLPQNRKLILFGAMSGTADHRKGFHLLNEALKYLSEKYATEYGLVIFGDKKDGDDIHGFPTYRLGTFYDELSIKLIYSAADIYVAPSLQDNLPNTLVESLAVGTPCIAFNIGGMPDLIINSKLGGLVTEVDSRALSIAILDVLNRNIDSNIIRNISLAERAEDNIAHKYEDVYLNA
ncbi:colanic acid biosynthesis glycosyltransferase WcaL [Escherichia coli]|uniref:glycosyltransferase n=1 Tax=Escherichia coli TaxID=562 RepID=UPI000DA4DB8C|nr:glycosyltransferase [Escherichia coli]SQR61765.1 colanic acid biosynthesis glycosyltransferase WcaL [Escherichia coli]